MSIHAALTLGSSNHAATAGSEEPAAVWPGVPGYAIEAELGRGGMGVVFRARQIATGRLVALKLLRDSALAGPQELARFRLEALAAQRMRHPNIVEIVEVGEHDGRPYFAMELVEGGTLAQRLAGQPIDAQAAAEMIRTLALAVQHAHERNIVHRDLKPANVLLARSEIRGQTSDGSSGSCQLPDLRPLTSDLRPMIADFGLAKRLDGESTAWTQDGVVLGTLSYMSPEQAAGRVGAIGPTTDVYALGAILYELLTGRPPFSSEAWNVTAMKVLNEFPAAPSSVTPAVPRDLEAVCLKCLEKRQEDRYATAQQLADDLSRFMADESVLAAPVSEQSRLKRMAEQDGYVLAEEIACGPRSTVYRALQVPLGQPVAIKVFAPRGSREAWDERLRRGASVWSAIAHPQVIGVQRAGWWGDAAYVVMEYVPQGSLASRVAGRPLPIAQVYDLMESLIEAVNYLHRQGVVHGNLKSRNVLLAADGIPRLTDLRITSSLLVGSTPYGDDDAAALTQVAPELLEPNAELRPYTDTYGLGLIFYELLTGRLPFTVSTAAQAIQQVREVNPTPPSELNRSVTPQLDAACLRCLKKNPWRRFPRVFDLLAYLRYCRDGGKSLSLPADRKRGTSNRPPRPM
jgi:eukaryotic-like serine/threonine-protein kinase